MNAVDILSKMKEEYDEEVRSRQERIAKLMAPAFAVADEINAAFVCNDLGSPVVIAKSADRIVYGDLCLRVSADGTYEVGEGSQGFAGIYDVETALLTFLEKLAPRVRFL